MRTRMGGKGASQGEKIFRKGTIFRVFRWLFSMTGFSRLQSDLSVHPTLTGEWEPSSCEMIDHDQTWCQGAGHGHAPQPGSSGPEIKTYGGDIEHITEVMKEPNAILCGDSLTVLRTLPSGIFSSCITSPPYWDTRYAGFADSLGHEEDYRQYIRNLVGIFQEVRRTLTPSGTLWLVIGDTYASDCQTWWAMCRGAPEKALKVPRSIPDGFKPKDLMGIPWRLAMELQDDGWYLRSDIVWSIPNHRPEPVRDRPARSHDYVFLFAKSEQYAYYDNTGESMTRRTVWEIPTVHNPSIAYSVFPEPLVARCMRSGSRTHDIVLDPFFGSGTVGIVAKRMRRRYVGIELNPDYVALARKRIREVT